MILSLLALLGIVALIYRREHKLYHQHRVLTHREIATRLHPRTGSVTASTKNAPVPLARPGATQGD